MQGFEREYGRRAFAVAADDDLFTFMRGRPDLAEHLPGIAAYREAYGVR